MIMGVVVTVGMIALLPIYPLGAQRVAAGALDSARAPATAARKSPAVAGLAGLVLPGSGHWYAGEPGRGLLIASVYWSGIAIVAGGRTVSARRVGRSPSARSP